MGRKLLLISCVLLLIGFSCKDKGYQKPEGLIEEKQMVDILYDIHINESYINNYRRNSDSLTFNSEDLHFSVLEKYGVADSSFYQSIIYYSSLPKIYERIYREVVDRIVMLDEETNKKEAVKTQQE